MPQPGSSTPRKVVVATAVVLTLLTFQQVLNAGALWFALLALLYAAGTLLTAHGRVVGLLLVAAPSVALAVAHGPRLVQAGVSPGAYGTLPDLLITAVGVPLAVINLVVVAVELVRRRR